MNYEYFTHFSFGLHEKTGNGEKIITKPLKLFDFCRTLNQL